VFTGIFKFLNDELANERELRESVRRNLRAADFFTELAVNESSALFHDLYIRLAIRHCQVVQLTLLANPDLFM